MKIQINEVWNAEGRSQELAIIQPIGSPFLAVMKWIEQNRPDLELALHINAHGYHAIALPKGRE